MKDLTLASIYGTLIFAGCGGLEGEGSSPETEMSVSALMPTIWISEENSPEAHCPSGLAAVGLECSGSYCDNVRLLCDDFSGVLDATPAPWSVWFEANGRVSATCSGTDEWVTGIQCRGDYCDDIRIQCRRGTESSRKLREHSTCAWTTEWISEENSPFSREDTGEFMRGIWCNGLHCDNKRFRSCIPTQACDRNLSCGFVAGADCQCDAACVSFGDCCSNRSAECG